MLDDCPDFQRDLLLPMPTPSAPYWKMRAHSCFMSTTTQPRLAASSKPRARLPIRQVAMVGPLALGIRMMHNHTKPRPLPDARREDEGEQFGGQLTGVRQARGWRFYAETDGLRKGGDYPPVYRRDAHRLLRAAPVA